MKRIAFALLVLIPLSGFAQNSYLCLPNSSAGFSYNNASKKWERSFFNVGDTKNLLNKSAKGWVWSEFGEKGGYACKEPKDGSVIRCDLILGELIFDKKTQRYIKTYVVGYTDGRDDNNNTPNMTIGSCTPL